MNSLLLSQLQQLNFSPNEAKVYLALLETGQTSAGEIIKKTQLHRSVVYETLEKLIYKKLVFKLERNKITFFQPTDPSRLLQNVETQKEIVQELVPKLKNLLKEELPEIIIYQGIESYKRFWIESANNMPHGSTDYVAGSVGDQWFEFMGKDYNKYLAIRLKRQIKWKHIIFNRDDLEMGTLKKYPHLTEFRLIDKKIDKYGNFNVLADQSVVLQSIKEPMIIEVKNKNLVKIFQNLFDILWEIGEKVKFKK